ncbi:hypothetical protein DAPPUDRAFT_329942 [Daphnia pulex]|uniref:CUB domain-containing protein n=1 Tax=Daphnia pulex TaxID=6669 RepID=E9HI29_DAPPU|nr:hypothetical protein DAPPUDRAFT_329942 [Daphnia pulex]|eukprot:EFX68613.1 hypothetical protein DAPPUDRAFT_329942 [Daphnia pulex]
MAFFDATESDWPQPVLNKIYYSTANTLSVYSEFIGSDGFNCNWNTTPNENTTKFKLCRHGQVTSANGTIQPMAGNSTPRQCSFSIVAAPGYQIEFYCSAINLKSYDSIFQVAGTTSILSSGDVVEANKPYFSTAENEVVIASNLGKGDWIDCKWTTLRRENKTNFKLCRDGEATSAIGTITPTSDFKIHSIVCIFIIEAPADQRIEISCTDVDITEYESYLEISGITEYTVPETMPVINEVYHSDSNNKVVLAWPPKCPPRIGSAASGRSRQRRTGSIYINVIFHGDRLILTFS